MEAAERFSFARNFCGLCFEHFEAAYGAVLGAFAAADAFFVINGCKEVYNGDSLGRTVFLALHAADAAILTFFANDGAFFMVGTGDDCFFCLGNKGNDVVGAFAYAKSAATAFSGVNVCNAVNDADGVIGADGCAVSAAEAAIKACAFSAVEHFCCRAGIETLIDFFISLFVAIAAAMYECGKRFESFGFNSEDFGNCFCGCFAAGTAKVCRSAGNVCKSVCISVTAGKTACAAVCSGKTFADFRFDGVGFNAHEDIGKNKKKRACKAKSGNNKGCVQNNFSHLL